MNTYNVLRDSLEGLHSKMDELILAYEEELNEMEPGVAVLLLNAEKAIGSMLEEI